MRIAVIGGGVAGLAAADRLLQQGHQVLLFERGPEVGGQLRVVEMLGTRIECFYHHLFMSDTLMVDLIRELGLDDRLRWVASRVGFFAANRIWNFVTPLDLLRFGPLNLVARLRLGATGLYLQRQADWRAFEGYTAEQWLRRWAGRRAYETVWGPLLYGKFGSAAPEISMAWFHWKMRLRFGSRRGLSTEYLGYLVGSFAQVWEALGRRIPLHGGHVFTNAAVERINVREGRAEGLTVRLSGDGKAAAEAVASGLAAADREGALTFSADRVIGAIPSPVMMRLAPELPEPYTALLRSNRYQAVMCMLLTLAHPISHIYWMNISDRSIPFVAVIEQTNLLTPQEYAGRHVAYLSHYLSPEEPLYHKPDEEVFETYLPHLKKINPAFDRSWVEDWKLFREDAAQPIITTNYSRKIPPLQTPIQGLFMANNTQVYPEDRGQNYSVRIGREAADLAARP